MRAAKLWWALAFSAGLSACAIVQQDVTDLGATLADLEPAVLPALHSQPVAPVALSTIEASYRAALAVTSDPILRQQIAVRLADIEMAKGENDQIANTPDPEYFDDAVAQYNALLDNPDLPLDAGTDERLLYRLAKAYALDGRMAEANSTLSRLVARYPNSPFAGEARFRMAEHAFSQGNYTRAAELYQQVVDAGPATPFHTNAQYMVGWSLFKDNRFRASVAPFTSVLDELVPADGNLSSLSDADRGLVTDTLRVMGITFSYLDGADAIAEVYAGLGERHYKHLLYQQLGDFYLEKERFGDAAAAFETYTQAYPDTHRAPEFALKRLEVLKQGGLSAEVLAGKEAFVAQFGPQSRYWAGLAEPERDAQVKPTLALFLDELSSFYHAKGQALQAAWRDYDTKRKANPKLKPPEPAEPAFVQAAHYYQQFIEVFPEAPTVAEKTFLMAEALVEAGELVQAVAAYENVAFTRIDAEYGARAGYNALVMLERLHQQAARGSDAAIQWQAQKIAAAINFADFYPGDARAAEVLATAADTLFTQNQYERALPLAVRLTQWQPSPANDLTQTAWLIVAHIRFDQQAYAEAEAAYREVLARAAADDPTRAQVVERIAASMYQGAEQKMAAGDHEAALAQFLAIERVAPGSEIAIKAQYDAGNYLLEQNAWARAEALFGDFARRYPSHSLTPSLAPKFALIYQELQLWDKAAASLTAMAQNTSDPDAKRQTLYLAAELYQKSGRTGDAATAYKNYLKAYPEPFDLATEARYQLLQMATQARDRGERNYWLQQLIDADRKAGKNTTERAHYLAASAANEFALAEFDQFERIKLTLPIKKSFAQKKKALERTLDAYKTVINYGVGEFVTEANYRIGNVYSQLSRDLLASERPKGLDDLAMEQYEILLEEQAYPFEEKSVELLAANAERAWDGFYDQWVKQSLNELAKLLPARYGKQETTAEVSDGLL